MDSNAGRTVVIGLDGLDHALIERWIAEGYLPCLKELFASSHKMHTAPESLPGSEWVNFATGTGPGQHRYVHSTQLAPGSYEYCAFRSKHVTCSPFYKTLSDAGKRCIVLDMPVDRPFPQFNGIQVIDWGTEFKLAEFGTNPPEFKQELLERIGSHTFTYYGHTQVDNDSVRNLRGKLEQGIASKTALAADLLARDNWDFCFVSFCEGHKAGHFFWKYFDEAHPDHETVEPYLQHSLRDSYALIDRGVQEIVSMLSPADNIIVVSDRGMEPDYRGDHLMSEVLQRLELTAYRNPPATQARSTATKRRSALTRTLRAVARGLIPARLKPLARNVLGVPQPDWSRTKAFMLPNVGNSYIRINLKGREPHGIVEPGREYEELLSRIERELWSLNNPATGEPAIEDISFPRRLFCGPHNEELPDISILWRADAPVRALESPSIGTIAGRSPVQRPGNHRAEGFALARGPAFVQEPSSRDGDLRQWAPTILQIYGLPVPSHYEMSPLTEILATQPQSSQPPESTGGIRHQSVA